MIQAATTSIRGMVLLLVLLSPISSHAQSPHGQSSHADSPHHLSLFIGGTHLLEADDNGATLGLDYEYRVNELLGVGMVIEHAFEEIDADTILAVADIHTASGIIFQIGPGVEFGPHHDRFVFRFGGLYEFEYQSYTVSPQFHIDIAENADDSLVFGFAIGKAF